MVQWFDPAQTNGLTPYKDLGVLGQVGLILQNVADPNTLPQYNQAVNRDQAQRLQIQQNQRQLQQQTALQQLASDPRFATLNPQVQLQQVAAITGDPSALAQYNASQQITPYQQAQLDLSRQELAARMQKAPNYQFIQNPDGSVSVGNPQTGQLSQITQSPIFNSGLQPGQGTTLPNGKTVTLDESGKLLYGVDPVPGYVPIAGAVPTADDAKKVKAATASAEKLTGPNGLLSRYEEAINKYGSELGGRGEQILNGLKTDINLELKNVNELGALSGPDQSILDAQLYDPTSLGANARGIFSAVVTSPSQLAKESAQRLRTTIKANVNAGSAAAGYKSLKSDTGGWSIKPKGN